MAAKITAKNLAARATLDAWLAKAAAVLDALSAHADRDVEVFEGYMAAASLPCSTYDESRTQSDA